MHGKMWGEGMWCGFEGEWSEYQGMWCGWGKAMWVMNVREKVGFDLHIDDGKFMVINEIGMGMDPCHLHPNAAIARKNVP